MSLVIDAAGSTSKYPPNMSMTGCETGLNSGSRVRLRLEAITAVINSLQDLRNTSTVTDVAALIRTSRRRLKLSSRLVGVARLDLY